MRAVIENEAALRILHVDVIRHRVDDGGEEIVLLRERLLGAMARGEIAQDEHAGDDQRDDGEQTAGDHGGDGRAGDRSVSSARSARTLRSSLCA